MFSDRDDLAYSYHVAGPEDDTLRRRISLQCFPFIPPSPPPFVYNPNAPLPEFECEEMNPACYLTESDFDLDPYRPPSPSPRTLTGGILVDHGPKYPFDDKPDWEPPYPIKPLDDDFSESERSSPAPAPTDIASLDTPSHGEPSSSKTAEDGLRPESLLPKGKAKESDSAPWYEDSRIHPVQIPSTQRSATSIPTSSTSCTPSLTDASPSSSRSSSLAQQHVSKKRAFPDNTASDVAQPGPASRQSATAAGRFPCLWRQLIGGDCDMSGKTEQQHDRHILTHLPDTNGTVWASFKCQICLEENAEWKGSFVREDPCVRHLLNLHFKGQKFDRSNYMKKIARPWWWPCALFRTKGYREEVPPKPEGETRDWEQYLRDVIRDHPAVIDKTFLSGKGKDVNNGKDVGGTHETVEPARPAKRRKTASK